MICEYCCHTGKCLKSNPTRETACAEFRPLCKACVYNKITLETITEKVKEGKKMVDKPKTIEKHYCALTKASLDANDFCSKGKLFVR